MPMQTPRTGLPAEFVTRPAMVAPGSIAALIPPVTCPAVTVTCWRGLLRHLIVVVLRRVAAFVAASAVERDGRVLGRQLIDAVGAGRAGDAEVAVIVGDADSGEGLAGRGVGDGAR